LAERLKHQGFVFYFKEEFLACDILSEFPFFKVTEINLFEPEQAEAEKLAWLLSNDLGGV
jgi:hypothetical protein